jgi:hypothetical protein
MFCAPSTSHTAPARVPHNDPSVPANGSPDTSPRQRILDMMNHADDQVRGDLWRSSIGSQRAFCAMADSINHGLADPMATHVNRNELVTYATNWMHRALLAGRTVAGSLLSDRPLLKPIWAEALCRAGRGPEVAAWIAHRVAPKLGSFTKFPSNGTSYATAIQRVIHHHGPQAPCLLPVIAGLAALCYAQDGAVGIAGATMLNGWIQPPGAKPPTSRAGLPQHMRTVMSHMSLEQRAVAAQSLATAGTLLVAAGVPLSPSATALLAIGCESHDCVPWVGLLFGSIPAKGRGTASVRDELVAAGAP